MGNPKSIPHLINADDNDRTKFRKNLNASCLHAIHIHTYLRLRLKACQQMLIVIVIKFFRRRKNVTFNFYVNYTKRPNGQQLPRNTKTPKSMLVCIWNYRCDTQHSKAMKESAWKIRNHNHTSILSSMWLICERCYTNEMRKNNIKMKINLLRATTIKANICKCKQRKRLVTQVANMASSSVLLTSCHTAPAE